jgi:pyridoxal phosphate enzyme (YggS family)
MNVFANFLNIKDKIDKLSKETKLIVITKKQPIEIYQKIIDSGHCHFGENLVQEAVSKWTNVLNINESLQLHLVGALQTNKVDKAVNIFSYIHSLDRIKLADKLKDEEIKQKKKLKYFIQVNVAKEVQKSGIDYDGASDFIKYCITELGLNIIGLMCLPPANEKPEKYFRQLKDLSHLHNLSELSMGMSNDYISAIQNGATHVRIGSAIFNKN